MKKSKILFLFVTIFCVLAIGTVFLARYFSSRQEQPNMDLEQGQTTANGLEGGAVPSTNPENTPTAADVSQNTAVPVTQEDPCQARVLEINKTLDGFAQTIYTYDTSQRKYYEGAETYMTETGYDGFRALDAGIPPHEGQPPARQVISNLEKALYYYHFSGQAETEVMAKIEFSIGRNTNTQYIQLKLLETEAGWLIDSCEVSEIIQY